jgi:tRNA uridine 5-carboxymethylaminomethyl modification enzyme
MLSILSREPRLSQRPCHVTWTTARTKEIVARALDRSALYGGRIDGTGTRYCPSFEDKVVKFPDKDAHHVFIEPEGLDSTEVYPNGISNSLPLDVQGELIRSLPGLERAVMVRPGYAIEYDFVQPTELGQELMVKKLPGLFLAGQINGTSGYEEAAAQGLMAGLNAVRWLKDEEPVVLTRDKAYTGVMIDDLTTLGCDEPYRMFTSRAEYRLLLREENAAERLTPLGRKLGLVGEDQWALFSRRREARERVGEEIRARRIRPDEALNQGLGRLGSAVLSGPVLLTDLLKRPELSWPALVELIPELGELDRASAQAIEVELKYAGYVARQEAQVKRFKELENRRLPAGMDYGRLPGLTTEVVEKLTRIQPRCLGQAARIPGVTPAAVMVLAVQTKTFNQTSDSLKPADDTGRPGLA